MRLHLYLYEYLSTKNNTYVQGTVECGGLKEPCSSLPIRVDQAQPNKKGRVQVGVGAHTARHCASLCPSGIHQPSLKTSCPSCREASGTLTALCAPPSLSSYTFAGGLGDAVRDGWRPAAPNTPSAAVRVPASSGWVVGHAAPPTNTPAARCVDRHTAEMVGRAHHRPPRNTPTLARIVFVCGGHCGKWRRVALPSAQSSWLPEHCSTRLHFLPCFPRRQLRDSR